MPSLKISDLQKGNALTGSEKIEMAQVNQSDSVHVTPDMIAEFLNISSNKIAWMTSQGNILLGNEHSKTSLWLTNDSTITIPSYNSLQEDFYVEIYLKNPVYIVDVLTSGADSILEGFEFIEGASAIIKTPEPGVFALVGRVR